MSSGSHPILAFSDHEERLAAIAKILSVSPLSFAFFKDPVELLKTVQQSFQKTVPATCLIDLDNKDTKTALAILKTLHKVYNKKILIFGVVLSSKKTDPKLIESAKTGGITAIIQASADTVEVNTLIREPILKSFSAFKKATAAPLPKVIDWFFENVSLALAMVTTALEEISEIETKLKFYETKLMPYADNVIRVVQSMKKGDGDSMHLLQALRIYGPDNCRNLLVSLTLADALKLGFKRWASTDTLAFDPRQFLKFALMGVATFESETRYHHVAFCGGLCFDFLFHLNESAKVKNPFVRKIIETKAQECFNKARETFKKAKGNSDLRYEKQIITFYIMKEIGKIMMIFSHPDYQDYLAKVEKKNIPDLLAVIGEEAKYSITHNIPGSLMCQIVPAMAQASHSVLYSTQPYLIAKEEHEHDSTRLLTICK